MNSEYNAYKYFKDPQAPVRFITDLAPNTGLTKGLEKMCKEVFDNERSKKLPGLCGFVARVVNPDVFREQRAIDWTQTLLSGSSTVADLRNRVAQVIRVGSSVFQAQYDELAGKSTSGFFTVGGSADWSTFQSTRRALELIDKAEADSLSFDFAGIVRDWLTLNDDAVPQAVFETITRNQADYISQPLIQEGLGRDDGLGTVPQAVSEITQSHLDLPVQPFGGDCLQECPGCGAPNTKNLQVCDYSGNSLRIN